MEWLVVPTILAVFFGGWKLYQLTRPETLKRLADKMGWSYSRDGRSAAIPDATDTMTLVYRGARTLVPMGDVANVMTARSKGRDMGVCDVSFQARPRDMRATRLTLWFVKVERLPQFALGIQVDGATGGQPRCLTPGFRRAYRVEGLSDFQAEKVLKPALQEWFGNYPGYAVSINAFNWVVIHRDGFMAPKDYRRMADMVVRIVEVLEESR